MIKAFGRNNYTAAYNHFMTYGYKEGRIDSEYYNGVYYKNKYGDLRNMSYSNLILHYVTYGINEKRCANSAGKLPNIGTATTNNTASSFQWPCTNYYVCGNNWSTYYSVKGRDHLGVDIKSRTGDSNIYATANGTVAMVGHNSANGNCVIIKHNINGKTVYSFYGHLKSYCVVKGQNVSKGENIGVIGTTGSSSTGVHLHFAFTTQCSTGTWGYGTAFSNSSNVAKFNGYTYYNPAYVIQYGRLP